MSRRFWRDASRKQVRYGGLCALARDVFVGGGIGEIRDQIEAGLSDSGADTIDESQLPDRRDKRFVVHQLLHFRKDRGAAFRVEFHCLLRGQCVDVGIAAIDICPALDDESVEASGGIPERARATLNEVLIGLVSPTL